jgi:F0F1-type ATP synthase epsilon subunit
MSINKLFKLKVRDAHEIVYEGGVDRISSFNEVGPFDVYPMHANFISIINKNLSIYRNNKKIQEIPLDEAVLKVKQDIARVFLGLNADTISELNQTPKTEAPLLSKTKS